MVNECLELNNLASLGSKFPKDFLSFETRPARNQTLPNVTPLSFIATLNAAGRYTVRILRVIAELEDFNCGLSETVLVCKALYEAGMPILVQHIFVDAPSMVTLEGLLALLTRRPDLDRIVRILSPLDFDSKYINTGLSGEKDIRDLLNSVQRR